MGLQENIRTEPVEQLKIRNAITVGATTVIREAVQMMRDGNVGCVVVIDDDQKPIGVFTESMLTEVLAHHPSAIEETIEKHVAQRFPWVRSSDPIMDVVESMQVKNVRILCVLDEQDRVVGYTGQRGLMEYVAEHFPGQVMVQRIGQSSYLSDREGA
jgi:CBS domain-containing protein